MNMKKDFIFNGFDISKITQSDLTKFYKSFSPILISIDKDLSDEEFRILEIKVFAKTYKINDLYNKIKELFEKNHPEIFD